MSSLGHLGEFGLIARLTKGLPVSGAVVEGIGDDCAVLRWGDRLMLATCDASLEEVHFSRRHTAAEDIGWRAAASALSDIAAMGGQPIFVLVTLACPKDTSVEFLEALYRGLSEAVQTADAVVVGGDTTGSTSGVVIDIAVLGEATGERPLLRRDAHRGDYVVVTGYPGASAAGLAALQQGIDAPDLMRAHWRPQPRIAEGQWLARRPEVHAMIDVSDGLSQDAGHIADASGLTIALNSASVPVHPALHRHADQLALDPIAVSLSGGEAYELAFTVAGESVLEDFREAFPDLPATVVGRCEAGPARVLIDGQPAPAHGFQHFG